jgi:hypothetical protein
MELIDERKVYKKSRVTVPLRLFVEIFKKIPRNNYLYIQ